MGAFTGLDPTGMRAASDELQRQGLVLDDAFSTVRTALALADLADAGGLLFRLSDRADLFRAVGAELDHRATLVEQHRLAEALGPLKSWRPPAEIAVVIELEAKIDRLEALVENSDLPHGIQTELAQELAEAKRELKSIEASEAVANITASLPNLRSVGAIEHAVAERRRLLVRLHGPTLAAIVERLLGEGIGHDRALQMARVEAGQDRALDEFAAENGLSVEDVELAVLLNKLDELDKTADRVGGYAGDSMRAERDAGLVDLFGSDLANEIIPLLSDGMSLSEALAELSRRADEEAASWNIQPGIQAGDVAAGLKDGLWDAGDDLAQSAKGLLGFFGRVITDPAGAFEEARQKTEDAIAVAEVMWGYVETGDLDVILEQVLLPLLGIDRATIEERGLDYAIAYLIGSNPDVLLPGGAARRAISRLAELADQGKLVAAAGAIDYPRRNRGDDDLPDGSNDRVRNNGGGDGDTPDLAAALVSPDPADIDELVDLGENAQAAINDAAITQRTSTRKPGDLNAGHFSLDPSDYELPPHFPQIPSDAVAEAATVTDRISYGVSFKWFDESYGATVQIRIHGPDSGAPSGSNSALGDVMRIKIGKRQMDAKGEIHIPSTFKFGHENFDERAANDVHIVWPLED